MAGLKIILPLRVRPSAQGIADIIKELTEVDLSPFLAPPAVVPPTDPGGGVYAFPPIGVSDWSRDAGQRIADHLSSLMGLTRRSYAVAVVFAEQANHEDANGNSAESQGAAFNNPLNLSAPNDNYWEGQNGRYLNVFAKFDTLDDGAAACALNYFNGPEYANVRDAFKADDPINLAKAIQDSPWDADHYGGNLLSEVAHALGLQVA